jgi:hypothetical protein
VDEGLVAGADSQSAAVSILARKLFYNQSWFDGNKVQIDPAPIAGGNNDDADAYDYSKQALLPGDGQAQFRNWTGYDKGINGLIYDFGNVPVNTLPEPADFTFSDIGRAGTSMPRLVLPSAFSVQVVTSYGDWADVRVVVTFPNSSIRNTWLQVSIGTGFGLPAADVHWWGNVVGDTGQGNELPIILVNPTDEIKARMLPRTPGYPADVANPYDINKDRLVNPTDQIIIRTNLRTPANAVIAITR